MILLIFSISFTTAFAITELQKATISDPRLENAFRVSIGNNVNVDQQFQISADITNNQEKSQKNGEFTKIIDIEIINKNDYITANITDNGIGFTKENIKNIINFFKL